MFKFHATLKSNLELFRRVLKWCIYFDKRLNTPASSWFHYRTVGKKERSHRVQRPDCAINWTENLVWKIFAVTSCIDCSATQQGYSEMRWMISGIQLIDSASFLMRDLGSIFLSGSDWLILTVTLPKSSHEHGRRGGGQASSLETDVNKW